MKKIIGILQGLLIVAGTQAMQRPDLTSLKLDTGKVVSVNGPVLSSVKTDASNLLVLTPSTLYWINAQSGIPIYTEAIRNGSKVALVHTQDFRHGRWAIGYNDGRIQILDSIKGGGHAVRSWLTGHTKAITALTGVKDPYLISGSADGTVKVWDAATGKELKSFNANKAITSVTAQVNPQNILSITAGLNDGSSVVYKFDLSGKAQQQAIPSVVLVPPSITPSEPVTSTTAEEEEEVLEAR